VVLIAILSNANALDQLHHKIWASCCCSARIEDFRDVRVVHEGQRLAFRVEARHNLLRIHPQFHDLESHSASDRLQLLGHVNDTESTLADLLQEFVAVDDVAGLFRNRRRDNDSASRGRLLG